MYVKANNQIVEKFPYTINDLRKDNPNTSFPREISTEVASQFFMYPVKVSDKPSAGHKQVAVQNDAPEYQNGEWVLGWQVRDLTEAEFLERLATHQELLQIAVTNYMNKVVASKNYDSVLSACSYAAFDNPFQQDGMKAIEWRSNVWTKCYQILDMVKSGQRPIPTEQELLSELPKLEW